MAGHCPNEIDHSRIIPFKISYPLTLFKSLFPANFPQTASKFPTKLPPFTLIRPGAIPKVPMSIVAAWAAQEIKDRPLRARVEVIAEPLKARIKHERWSTGLLRSYATPEGLMAMPRRSLVS